MNAPVAEVLVRNTALGAPPQGPVPLPDGSEQVPLGSGVITQLLGRGGMAAVYEIWNAQLEMYRAVKLIHPNATESVHERFQTEIKISAKLSHPNIVEIHGVGEWKGLPFIEMEKIEGVGLDSLIAQRGALPAFVCTAVGIQVCRALDYAHHQECTIYGRTYRGVIHRDLKPSNIMVCTNGVVKLMDFGIARPPDVSFHTMDGLIAGTLQYLAPEQLEKRTLDFRTDIYALGVTMYEVLAGINAFPQTAFAQLVSDKTRNRFRPLEEYHVHVPARLKRVIYKCMHQDPARRYPSARELMSDLQKIHVRLAPQKPEQVLAALVAAPKGGKIVLRSRRRFPIAWSAAAATFALAVVLGYVYLRPFIKNRLTIDKTPEPLVPAQPPASAPATTTPPAAQAAPPVVTPSQTPAARTAPRVSAPTAPPVQKRAAQAPASRPNAVENLQDKYGTADLIDIMAKELAARNYRSVLSVFDALTPDRASSTHAQVLKLRALQALGDQQAVASLLAATSVNDGEFLLARAKLAYGRGDITGARRLLEAGLSSPHGYMDYDALKRETAFYQALCATARFDTEPSEATYKAALQAWWELRSFLRATPDHEYNRRANAELQRMGEKMQKQGSG